MYYVYLLKSTKFDKTYIGSTKDLKRRLKEHNAGLSFSTKSFLPWRLIYYEAFVEEKAARHREKNLKYNGNAVRELKKRIFLSKSGAGYTLIEILVGLTIVGLLFGFGFVSFRDFSRRQSLAGSAKRIQGDLRLAQESALSGKKPDDFNCNPPNVLSSYSFKVYGASNYKIEANCTAGAVVIKNVDLAADISISTPSPNPIMFKVLGEGTNIPAGGSATLTLTQEGTNKTFDITVSASGEIK